MKFNQFQEKKSKIISKYWLVKFIWYKLKLKKRCFAGHWCSEQLGVGCQPEPEEDHEIKEANRVLENFALEKPCDEDLKVCIITVLRDVFSAILQENTISKSVKS